MVGEKLQRKQKLSEVVDESLTERWFIFSEMFYLSISIHIKAKVYVSPIPLLRNEIRCRDERLILEVSNGILDHCPSAAVTCSRKLIGMGFMLAGDELSETAMHFSVVCQKLKRVRFSTGGSATGECFSVFVLQQRLPEVFCVRQKKIWK